LSVPVQVIAWGTVSEMTCNVSSGMLKLTQSLTHSAVCRMYSEWLVTGVNVMSFCSAKLSLCPRSERTASCRWRLSSR